MNGSRIVLIRVQIWIEIIYVMKDIIEEIFGGILIIIIIIVVR